MYKQLKRKKPLKKKKKKDHNPNLCSPKAAWSCTGRKHPFKFLSYKAHYPYISKSLQWFYQAFLTPVKIISIILKREREKTRGNMRRMELATPETSAEDITYFFSPCTLDGKPGLMGLAG